MPKPTPEQRRAAAIIAKTPGNDPTFKFYVQKKTVRPMLGAIVELQTRPDISGKFARKIAVNRRALSKADEVIIEERKALTLQHAEKYPPLDKDGEPHPKANEPTPVYSTKSDGEPVFKKDEKGNNTEERVVMPDQYNVANPQLFAQDFTELLDEYVVVECPGFTEDDWNKFSQIKPGLVDPLLDLDPSGDTRNAPEGWEDEKPAIALVEDKPTDDVVNEDKPEERTAP